MNTTKHYVKVFNDKYSLLKDLVSYEEEIQNRINETNFFENVFLMMKYRNYNKKLSDYIIEVLKQNNLNGVRADMRNWNITAGSIQNPLAVLYCCKYGIALFDKPDDGQDYGPNVAYELGIMHLQNKNCLILIHEDIKDKKPFDILGKMHKTYKDQLDVKDLIIEWIEENNIKPNINNKINFFNVAVGIVKKDNMFLITKRKVKENNLIWSFPAVQIKPNSNQIELLKKEIKNETNINVIPTLKFGERPHPNTPSYVYYWLCDYISGEVENCDNEENEEVKWVTANEALELITSDIYPKLKELLINSKI